MLIRRRDLLLGAGATLVSGASAARAQTNPSYAHPRAIYEALRIQAATNVVVDGASIRLVFADGAPGIDRLRIKRWVESAARAVSAYFTRFPTQHYGLLIVAEEGDGIGDATTYGFRGPATRIHVGMDTTEGALARDWVLVHEMAHIALPDLPRRALWLQEGNATWIEPIARAQAKQISASEVWRQAIAGMPQGMRDPSAGGMDGTQEWGRLYWGGAIFWMLAEIAVYEQSAGRAQLRDALRAINRESGGNAVEWSPEKMMAVGDAATGYSALQRLYESFASHPVEVDLNQTFRRLGVSRPLRGSVHFDANAELAALTRRITSP
jgi:hypothetical protein